jgi:hypothetical protein
VTWHYLRVFKENAFGGEVIRDGPLIALISLLGTLLLVCHHQGHDLGRKK